MDWQIFQLAFACYFQEQMLQLKIMMIIQICGCTAGIIIFERESLYKWQMIMENRLEMSGILFLRESLIRRESDDGTDRSKEKPPYHPMLSGKGRSVSDAAPRFQEE